MAQAATPAAGTIISNQAAASYTDGQGVDRVSQSNAVETLVLPKAAFSLASDNTKQASPGSTVYFTHTLTNTGNAADTFKITVDKPANTVGSPASTCDIYIDEDGNGLPDSNTPIGACGTPFTTTSVLAGGLYRFVIGATVNGQASTGDEATIAVHAKSVTDPAATGAPEQNTDTLQIANGAAFNVNKSSNKSSGPTGSVITYTFTIANTGNAAGDLTITDALGNGPTAGLRYVSGSGTWSNGQGALTDASDGAEKRRQRRLDRLPGAHRGVQAGRRGGQADGLQSRRDPDRDLPGQGGRHRHGRQGHDDQRRRLHLPDR